MERTVLVTGGAGYVGSALCPELISAGYGVRVLDTCWYGREVLSGLLDHSKFTLVQGDIRNPSDVAAGLDGCTDVIHLACISNDPSYDLDPALGEEINFAAFKPLVEQAKAANVRRFIYASSSSVYGVKVEEKVTEDLVLEPLTDYSKFKALCEEVLIPFAEESFCVTILRPATVCGYSPRQRLDLVVNLLVNYAVNMGKIRVFGGEQFRPNLHIDDMVRAYIHVLQQPKERIQGKIFNVGGENHSVQQIAEIVRSNISGRSDLEILPTEDNRSYRISSDRILHDIGFLPKKGVEDAVRDLVEAFDKGLLPNSFSDSKYFNIERMNELIGATTTE